MHYLITEKDWKSLYGVFKTLPNIRAQNETKLRIFVEAVFYITRSGCQWRLLPCDYGQWRTIHKRFKRWSDRGIWEKLFDAVKHEQEPDTESVMIDATIVRAHACSAGYRKNSQAAECLGRSKGGFTTKISALIDALGLPLKFILSPSQRHDIVYAEALIEDVMHANVLADKGYDSHALVETIESQGCVAVIPPRRNPKHQRDYDKHLYKERHLIECFFGKIKHFRRIFSRFDKTAKVFMSFLHFVAVLIWLR